MWRRVRRARARIRTKVYGFTQQQTAHKTIVRTMRRALRVRSRIRRRVRAVGGPFTGKHKGLVRYRLPQRRITRYKQQKVTPPGTKFTGKTGVFPRVLKAINRMRRAMQARLRWKPRLEEIPPVISTPSRIHAIPRGTIYSAGASEGVIYSAGTKRGAVL